MKTPNTSHTKRLSKPPVSPDIKITVTPEGAALAERNNSSTCMWANALKEAVPGAQYVSVDLQTIRFTDPTAGLRYTYLTPRVVQEALIRFDYGLTWGDKPITIRLRNGAVSRAGKDTSRKIEGMPEGRRTRLAKKSAESTHIPAVVGGTTPPLAPLGNFRGVGKRRAFGVRGLSGWAVELNG